MSNYCVSNKSQSNLYSNLLYKIGKEFCIYNSTDSKLKIVLNERHLNFLNAHSELTLNDPKNIFYIIFRASTTYIKVNKFVAKLP